MADINQDNDEYEFADLDFINPGATEEDGKAPKPAATAFSNRLTELPDVKRNALIVVGIIIILVLGYKLAGAVFSKKKATVETTTTVVNTPPAPFIEPQVKEETPVVAAPSAPQSPELLQKMSDMDMSQQNLRADVNNLNSQLGGMNSNMNAMNSKLADLSQMLASLSATVQQQNNQIEQLVAARVSVKKSYKPVRHAVVPQPLYYIQAVIPGRAWLIATNGTTITVREGTRVAGYGVIKLIDPVQGRVMTSSGRMIRFSQQDS